jgi:hypothetical protein
MIFSANVERLESSVSAYPPFFPLDLDARHLVEEHQVPALDLVVVSLDKHLQRARAWIPRPVYPGRCALCGHDSATIRSVEGSPQHAADRIERQADLRPPTSD